MLCCVCLGEDRDAVNTAVTYVSGNAVCREHVRPQARPARNGQVNVAPLLTAVIKGIAAARAAQADQPAL